MKNLLILISICCLGLAMDAPVETVKFHDDFSKAQRIAKKQNKILLVDFTAKWVWSM